MSRQLRAGSYPPGELRKLYRLAIAQGWDVAKKGGQRHWHWRSPTGDLVITNGSPAGGRAFQNARAQLKRAGLRLS